SRSWPPTTLRSSVARAWWWMAAGAWRRPRPKGEYPAPSKGSRNFHGNQLSYPPLASSRAASSADRAVEQVDPACRAKESVDGRDARVYLQSNRFDESVRRTIRHRFDAEFRQVARPDRSSSAVPPRARLNA